MRSYSSAGLGGVLFGKTRSSVLGLLFGKPDRSFYLREIVRAAGGSPGAVQRELTALAGAGLVVRSRRGNQVHYQADRNCPIYSEIKSVVTKTVGLGDALREALEPLADRIRFAFVFGSLAAGTETSASDTDLMVVGDVRFGEVVAALQSAQERLGREINPTVYPPAEFLLRIRAEDPFLTAVLRGPKLFLIGDAHALPQLAPKRMAR